MTGIGYSNLQLTVFINFTEYNWEESKLPTKENAIDDDLFLHTHKADWEDEFDAVEEEMEANVSKLLLDDMDDCDSQDDNAKASVLFYSPPKVRTKAYSTYLGFFARSSPKYFFLLDG